MVSIKEMAVQVHANACAKGWWGEKNPLIAVGSPAIRNLALTDALPPVDAKIHPRDKFESLYGLIITEVAEAVECVRHRQFKTVIREDGKPEGFPSEVADIAIRILDVSEAYGFDIEASVIAYMLGDGPAINHGLIRAMTEEGFIKVSIEQAATFCADPEPVELSENVTEVTAMLYRTAKALCKQEEQHIEPDDAITQCLIGVFYMCAKYGINLENEILQKHTYNKVRSFKHGGKAL